MLVAIDIPRYSHQKLDSSTFSNCAHYDKAHAYPSMQTCETSYRKTYCTVFLETPDKGAKVTGPPCVKACTPSKILANNRVRYDKAYNTTMKTYSSTHTPYDKS